jgi:hypothetical protein
MRARLGVQDGIMNALNSRAIPVLFGFGFFLALTGCVGYVQGDGGVEVAEPDMLIFGGYADGAPARDYARRGDESRGADRSAVARSAPPARSGGGGRR